MMINIEQRVQDQALHKTDTCIDTHLHSPNLNSINHKGINKEKLYTDMTFMS